MMRLLSLVVSAAVVIGSPFSSPSHDGVRNRVRKSSSIADCPGYRATNVVKKESSLTADLKLAGDPCDVYGDDLLNLKLEVEYQTDARLHVKIYDKGAIAYQVQESVLPRPKSQNVASSKAAIQFSFTEKPFSFAVTRTGSNEVLFNTSGSQLIFESQYLRLRTKLPEKPNLYGLGEHSDSFRLETNNYQRVLWNSESPFVPRKANLYGSHPVYFEHRKNAGTHGVFLLNSNGMNINISRTDAEGQYLEYNTIGGVLDFYFLAGPSPAEVSKQYAEVVGLPAMMPYWSFGFHQCKYGWQDVNAAAEVVGNYSTAGIPLEVLWGDIDYMDRRQDFTVDPDRYPLHKMRELVDTLHQRGQYYVMMLDPGIHRKDGYEPFTVGDEKQVFLKAQEDTNYRGMQWAGEVVWPDWLAPQTQEWWTDEIKKFFDPAKGIDVDGLWNDMNEASNFCGDPRCDLVDNPPVPTTSPRPNTGRPIPGFPADFQPSSPRLRARQEAGSMKGLPGRNLFTPKYRINNHVGELSGLTIWTNISNADGTAQYDTHNFYGTTMAMTSRASLIARRPSKRPFVLTRSTWAGAGRAVAHWFGDNYSSWDDYRFSITQMLTFAALHAMPMVGSDVCGFNGNAQERMCARWATLGAFQPFYRNHADISAPVQEFYQWPLVTAAAKNAIDARYRLLDYIYTAMYRASKDGSPIVEPVWFRYPEDENTFGIQLQWFYGDALLISPVTDNDSKSVTYYLPDDVFYDFWTLETVRGQGGDVVEENVDWTDIPVHIRGGTIIPLRSKSANTTAGVRKNNFTLIVAPGLDGKAEGSLYLDDGDSLNPGSNFSDIRFTWDGKQLSTDGTFGYATDVVVEAMQVLGQSQGVEDEESSEARSPARRVDGKWSLKAPFKASLAG